MNKTHRIVWSETRQAYVVAHEKVASHGKPSSTRKAVVSAVAAALLSIGAGQAMADGCTVISTSQAGTYNMANGECLDVQTTGTISGDERPAIEVRSGTVAGTISNNGGKILGFAATSDEDDYGLRINAGGIVASITNSGTIGGEYSAGVYVQGRVSGIITNSGTIFSGDGSAIYLRGGTIGGGIHNSNFLDGDYAGINVQSSLISNGITNTVGGTISGGGYGIQVHLNSTVTGGIVNDGMISAGSDWRPGIMVYRNSLVTDGITNSGDIIGGANSRGIWLLAASLTGGLANSGHIYGGDAAVLVSGSEIFGGYSTLTGGIHNLKIGSVAGTITGHDGIVIDGVQTISGGITNAGLIEATGSGTTSGEVAIKLENGALLRGGINNDGGTISAGGSGIAVLEGTSGYASRLEDGITNSGLISGSIGIQVGSSTISGGIHNLSGGRISGSMFSIIATGGEDGSLDSITNDSGGTINGAIVAYTSGTDVTNNGLWIMNENPESPNSFMPSLIQGNLLQGSTGTMRIGAYGTASGEYSQLTVSGTATLGGTLNVDVKSGSPLAQGNTLDNVITASGSITGTFASITDNSALFDFAGVYHANDFDLALVAPSSGTGVLEAVTSQGNTPATGVATVLDVLIDDYLGGGTGNADIDALLNALGALSTAAEVSQAASQLLPLLTGGSQIAAGVALNGINRVIQARIESNRGFSSGDDFLGDKKFWLKPFGSWADQNDRMGVSGYAASTGGLALGADTVLNANTRLGVAFAYAKASVDGNDHLQKADVAVYQLLGYGSVSLNENSEINFQVGVGQNDNEGSRAIPLLNEVAKADYRSTTATLGVGYGHSYSLSERTRLTASVRADYSWMKDKGYTETGSSANLTVDSRSTDELITLVEGKLTHEINPGLTLLGNLGVGYDLLSERASITAAFAGAPTASFSTQGLDPSPWLVRGGLGLSYQANDRTEITARYDAEYRQDFLNQTASVKVRWAF